MLSSVSYLAVLACIASLASAYDFTVDTPSKPVVAGQPATFTFSGVNDASGAFTSTALTVNVKIGSGNLNDADTVATNVATVDPHSGKFTIPSFPSVPGGSYFLQVGDGTNYKYTGAVPVSGSGPAPAPAPGATPPAAPGTTPPAGAPGTPPASPAPTSPVLVNTPTATNIPTSTHTSLPTSPSHLPGDSNNGAVSPSMGTGLLALSAVAAAAVLVL